VGVPFRDVFYSDDLSKFYTYHPKTGMIKSWDLSTFKLLDSISICYPLDLDGEYASLFNKNCDYSINLIIKNGRIYFSDEYKIIIYLPKKSNRQTDNHLSKQNASVPLNPISDYSTGIISERQ